VTRLTDAVRYVTPPRYDGLHSVYLNNYDGDFHLQVSDNESVLIKFVHFTLEPMFRRCYDYLQFNELNHRRRECGTQRIPSQVYRSSIHLFFHTDGTEEFTGFKMVYAIFPRSQEPQPQELSDNMYNCSVSLSHLFKPLLGCNLVRDCQGNEDEKGCSYASSDCGDGALWQWRDGRQTIFSQSSFHSPQCGFYNPLTNTASSDGCSWMKDVDVLCEFSKPTIRSVNKTEIHLVSRYPLILITRFGK